MGTIRRTTRKYVDFDLNFLAHPLTGDVTLKYNDDAIKRAVKQLIFFNKFDKKYHPEIHSGVREMLFEPMSAGTAVAIESRIRILVRQYEPRIELLEINALPNYESNIYEIELKYTILNTLLPTTQNIFLKRVR